MSEPITPSQPTVEDLQAKIATLESEKTNLVGELTQGRETNRTKLSEKEAEIETLKTALAAAVEKNQANPEEQKIMEVVQKVLGNETQKSAERNRDAAFTQFVTENNEYHPDNDTGGLKLAALRREFAGFNTTGLVEREDFLKVIGKAHALLRGTDTPRQTTDNPYSSTPSQPAAPAVSPVTKVSEHEKKVIEANGWTEEQYLKLKDKYPDMIEDLIRPVVH